MENNANQLNSMLCKRNCGFFGNAAYDGYCSKCYKDHVKRQNSGSAAGRVTPTQPSVTTSTPTVSSPLTTPPETMTTEPTTTTVVLPTSQPIAIPTRTSQISEAQTVGDDANNNAMSQDQAAMPPPAAVSVAAAAAAAPASSSQLSTSLMSTDESLMSTSLPASGLAGSMTDSGASPASVSSEKKKRTRCCVESCKRKVGLTGFDCRCGGLYCWEHRYSDKHDCKFDYKELGQDQIRKNNPIVVGEKIQKI